ncbi:MAG: hypothetical protein AB7D07_05165 [Desulfovibrionaceae bacterium]|jgi:hypothetical protein
MAPRLHRLGINLKPRRAQMSKDSKFSEAFISASKSVMKDNPRYFEELQKAIELSGSDLFGDLRTWRDKKKFPVGNPKDYRVW